MKKIDILGESFMAYQGIANENDNPLRTLLVQNFVTGCATAINGPLLKHCPAFSQRYFNA